MSTLGRLLVTCDDKPGIVAKVSNFFYEKDLNILDLDQHASALQDGQFFMRLAFQSMKGSIDFEILQQKFSRQVADSYNMVWKITDANYRKKVAILVSKHDHALLELLWLWKKDELSMDITMVISNHDDLREVVEGFGLTYHYIPVTHDTKAQAEQELIKTLGSDNDFIVLARYMQILSDTVVDNYSQQIINIHHSFLPAFKGADPYKQAYEYGVKVIGATAHYVTAQLDAGPIIEQDIYHVNHRHHVQELRSIGKDLERRVLARAVKWQLQDRILVDNNKTVVFK